MNSNQNYRIIPIMVIRQSQQPRQRQTTVINGQPTTINGQPFIMYRLRNDESNQYRTRFLSINCCETFTYHYSKIFYWTLKDGKLTIHMLIREYNGITRKAYYKHTKYELPILVSTLIWLVNRIQQTENSETEEESDDDMDTDSNETAFEDTDEEIE